MNIVRVSTLLLVIATVAVGTDWWLKWERGQALRDEIALAQQENRDLVRLRAENARLTAQQPSAVELERLRADHAAVVRLRGELEALRADVERREARVSGKLKTETLTR